MNLRKPSNEEIDRITTEMVAQVHSTYNLRNRTVNNNVGKASRIFIKDITDKMDDGNKEDNPGIVKTKDSKNRKCKLKKKVQFQGMEVVKMNTHEKKPNLDVIRQVEKTSRSC